MRNSYIQIGCFPLDEEQLHPDRMFPLDVRCCHLFDMNIDNGTFLMWCNTFVPGYFVKSVCLQRQVSNIS